MKYLKYFELFQYEQVIRNSYHGNGRQRLSFHNLFNTYVTMRIVFMLTREPCLCVILFPRPVK